MISQIKTAILIVIINFFLFNNIYAEEKNIELDSLFNQLKTNDLIIALKTEKKIWKIWSTYSANDRKGHRLTDMLAQGDILIREKNFSKAIDIFSLIISIDSNWAEAWSKRATVLYLSGRYEDSIKDIEKVLQLEPRHFGALSVFGLNQVELKNYKAALRSYQEAQKIYPTMKVTKKMILMLKELIDGQKI
jgi:tetratricopeptide (TPR) repeat protein